MTSLPTKKTIHNLCNKGFEKGRDGKHIPYNYRARSGKKTSVTTHISHTPSHRDLTDRIISSMAQQCQLSRGDFIKLADCTMGQYEYEMILKEQGIIIE